MDKKTIVNDLYQAAVISVFAVGYSMLGKKILKMAPPSIRKFDLEDTEKLVAIVAASEMTREYLIKQKIPYICDHQVGYSAGGYSLSPRWFLTWYIYPFFQD